jgi:transposase
MTKLTEKEKSSLEMSLKQTAEQANEHTRVCIILGYHDGLSPEELAKAFRLSLSTIYNYLKAYTCQEKTKNAPRGGTSSFLSKEQSQALIEYLKEHTYTKVKDICAYVREQYGISYSRSGLNDWLKEHEFVYKKPKKVPGKLDPQQQEDFIAAYQGLKEGLKPKEEIYFIDAVHPAYQSQAAFGWIQKGEEKTLQSTGKQVSLTCATNMMAVYV